MTVFIAVLLRVGERNTFKTVSMTFVFTFYFLIALQSDNIGNTVYVFTFWAHVRAHFNPHLTVQARMSLSRPKTYLCPRS